MKIKICCIASITEAELAIEAGASVLGLVGPMPSGPGVIPNEQIAKIAAKIPENIETFLLTSEIKAEEIISHHQLVHTSGIQLVDRVSKEDLVALRKGLPTIKLVQVVHVLDESAIPQAKEVAPYVDCLLLDSGNSELKVKELGGTGRTHNWEISRRIVQELHLPVFLAGGLTPLNIRKAISTVNPFGVDVCSGVRTDGKLDKKKLIGFVKRALQRNH